MSRTIDQTLDKLETSKMLTPDGRSWLVAACDPFHDSDMSLAGYPDVLTASTVVQLVKKQMQITVPSTVTSGSNWDCSIALFPQLSSNVLNVTGAMSTASNGISSVTAYPSTAPMVGGLCVSAAPQGNNLWPNFSQPTPLSTYTSLNCAEYLKGNVRLIAAGFEVVNTTSENNAQGQVTVWRQPAMTTPATTYYKYAGPPVTYSQINPTLDRFPPANISDAQLLFGSRSWAAVEGNYTVLRQSTLDNPAYLPVPKAKWYTNSDPASTGAITAYFASATTDPVASNSYLDITPPFDVSGAHYTGLSYSTTLTVNVRWFIERMPGPSESDLVVLATPSSPYDSLALELYAKCMRDMPPAVMLKENPLGEWFKAALGQVANYAPRIGNMVGNFVPGAAAIGNVVGQMARTTSSLGRSAPPPAPPPHLPRLPQSMINQSPLARTIRPRNDLIPKTHRKNKKRHQTR